MLHHVRNERPLHCPRHPNLTLPQNVVASGLRGMHFTASCLGAANKRMALSILRRAALLARMLGLPLTPKCQWGITTTSSKTAPDFEPRFVTATQFQFHLGSVLVREIDALFLAIRRPS